MLPAVSTRCPPTGSRVRVRVVPWLTEIVLSSSRISLGVNQVVFLSEKCPHISGHRSPRPPAPLDGVVVAWVPGEGAAGRAAGGQRPRAPAPGLGGAWCPEESRRAGGAPPEGLTLCGKFPEALRVLRFWIQCWGMSCLGSVIK